MIPGKHEQLGIANKTRRQPITAILGKLYVVALFISHAVRNALNDEFREFFLHHTPIRRMATPEEIANAVLYFASDESQFTTGQILEVCGGFGLATPVFGDLQDKSRAAA